MKFLLPKRLIVALALAASVLVSFGAQAANYTIELTNATGLDPSEYTIFVMGFSAPDPTKSKGGKMLGPLGTLTDVDSGATVSSYQVGTGSSQINEIQLDTHTPFIGGRFYFFVVKHAPGIAATAPSVTFGNQPPNPGTDPTYPVFSIVEITVPAPAAGVAQNATADVQTVDGFTFPLTIALNKLTTAGNIYGQPLGSSAGARDAILGAYTKFMTALGTAGAPYLDMVYLPNSILNQAGGILNPGAYLTAANGAGTFLNLGSPLHTIFDADLGTLFSSKTLQLQGVPSNPSGVAGQFYTVAPEPVTPDSTFTYADTGIKLPALKLTGYSSPGVPTGDVFHIINPVGISVLANSAGGNIFGSINVTEDKVTKVRTTKLTIPNTTTTPGSGNKLDVVNLTEGLYIAGAGFSPTAGKSTNTISEITQDGTNLVLTITPSLPLGDPAPNSQYIFSKQPYVSLMLTSGQMVFANSGFFADSVIQFPSDAAKASVLASLENYMVTALNRGVGIAPGAVNPSPSTGNNGTSLFWGTPTNWYPPGATQNLFSLFMHTATVGDENIFRLPANYVNSAGNRPMAAAYGFAYDENGGPNPPVTATVEVPAKFDGTITPGSSIQVTLGAWTSQSGPVPTPVPAPTAKVDGKKTIKTSKKTVKINGTAVGEDVFVKYKKKPGKMVTKRVAISGNDTWTFKFKPAIKKTVLKFYSVNADGVHSATQKVKVIDEND